MSETKQRDKKKERERQTYTDNAINTICPPLNIALKRFEKTAESKIQTK